ncbi:MAG: filamentous hemagglutinin N-terminal domain-containing protein [Pelatocladus maniniholoensis HA4357-MV3]|jgi:filamentous hemagglutinin family protein|uniref:Filamentous hemagglutinin N-terminal domain-containing protein n=1 Tax=Pelatocladus maniniholoensis HA4357-MV3 TaxID=1117104 RepID=A0A9E3HCP1_9NOST|nr:filamentous hemagglutinin N-terminal domain-containing protein [Pelatocladus maniniholoensis HA4357-MV3]BAZ71037.1 filamentous hemagglutinin outer membrane protein [Fischerella sp. NIES-4106]
MPGSKSKTSLELLGFVIGSAIALGTNSSSAQIIPDSTLPSNSNVQLDGNTFNITGGTQAGSNLFHSFQEFSVPTGREAFFNNAAGIQNIINRVTGASVSNIDGLIRANGTANLFLINPNGIIFGPNASLNIGGSFVGSTASSIKFADGISFDTQPSRTEPLLTVSVPVGLGFGTNPGDIRIKGDSQGIRKSSNLIDTSSGLRVQPNQTLGLVGGDISLEGATIKTAGGRIELGSVGENSLVSINPINKGFSFGYESTSNYRDIQLSQQAAVDASGKGGGDIQVIGRQITLSDGSQIENSTLENQAGGTFIVTGLESVELNGISSQTNQTALGAQVYPRASGTGSNLSINTEKFLVRNGAQVDISTYGQGAAGSLTISANEVVELSGVSEYSYSALYALNFPTGTGNSGNLTIKTGRLLVRDGANIFTGTLTSGLGGNLEIFAREIEVSGMALDKFPSTIGASAEPRATGSSGNVTLSTQHLIVRDGAFISTGTSGRGRGGNLSIRADSIELKGGSSSIFGKGGLSAESRGIGESGNLTIETRHLSADNGAQVTVRNSGTGNAGFLQINADSIKLTNTGSITAATSAGEGGNITIHADTLAALENSKITANAFEGRGGNIRINTTGLFLSPDSTITASSDRGINGTVEINAPNPNFTKAAVTIPTQIDIPKIGAICSRNRNDAATGEFVNIGKGGLPPNPLYDPLDISTGWQDSSTASTEPIHNEPTQEYIEAQGWAPNPDGTIRLTTEPTLENVTNRSHSTLPCNQIGQK